MKTQHKSSSRSHTHLMHTRITGLNFGDIYPVSTSPFALVSNPC